MFFKNLIIKESLFLKFMYYCFKLTGLSCASLCYKTSTNNSFSPSKLGILYNSMLILLIIVFNYYAIVEAYEVNVSPLEFDRAIDMARVSFAVISSVFILVTYCVRQKKATVISNRIKTIAELSVNLQSDNKLGNNGMLRPAKRIFFTSLIMWFLLIVMTPTMEFKVVLYYLAQNLCELVILFMLVQYGIILSVLKQLFEIINTSFFLISSEVGFAVYRRRRYHSNEFVEEVKLNRFSYLQELHLSLCEVAEDLSQFYSQSLLLCIAYIFASLVLYAYFCTNLVTQTKGLVVTVETIRYLIVQMLHYFVPTVIVTWSACAVIDESNRTGKIVNKCMGNSRDQYVAIKLNQFSNYLLHQKLTFTAAGLFSLDGTLIMSIAGSITTYMVILLQFQDSTKR